VQTLIQINNRDISKFAYKHYLKRTDQYFVNFSNDFNLNEDEFKLLQHYHYSTNVNLEKLFNRLLIMDATEKHSSHILNEHNTDRNNIFQLFLYDYDNDIASEYKPLFKNIFAAPEYFFSKTSNNTYSYMQNMDDILWKVKNISGTAHNLDVKLKYPLYVVKNKSLSAIYDRNMQIVRDQINDCKDMIDINDLNENQIQDYQYIMRELSTQDLSKLQALMINLKNLAKISICNEIFDKAV